MFTHITIIILNYKHSKLGWRYRQCRSGVDIFRSNESYLISLVDNEEECKAICEAMPECDLANFIVNTKFPEVNRCVPRKEFRGHCDRTFSLLKLVKSYIKNKTGKNYLHTLH